MFLKVKYSLPLVLWGFLLIGLPSGEVFSQIKLSEIRSPAYHEYLERLGAKDYDTTKTYHPGQLVSRPDGLYKNITAISIPETFSAVKWKKIASLGAQITDYTNSTYLKDDLTFYEGTLFRTKQAIASAEFTAHSATATYTLGAKVWYSGNIYTAKQAITTPASFDTTNWTKEISNISNLWTAVTPIASKAQAEASTNTLNNDGSEITPNTVDNTRFLTSLRSLQQLLKNRSSDLFELRDNTDPTKKIKFNIAGIKTGTTRTITLPDENITLVDAKRIGAKDYDNTKTYIEGQLALYKGGIFKNKTPISTAENFTASKWDLVGGMYLDSTEVTLDYNSLSHNTIRFMSTTSTNRPDDEKFYVRTKGDTTFKEQTATNGTKKFLRVYQNSTWSPWRDITGKSKYRNYILNKIDQTDGTTSYVGRTEKTASGGPHGAWVITRSCNKKFAYAFKNTTNPQTDIATAWTNRSTLTYYTTLGGTTTAGSDCFSLTSDSFLDSSPLPLAHSCQATNNPANPAHSGSNTSPHLTWTNIPTGTTHFTVIMDDVGFGPDGANDAWIHWGVYSIPVATTSLSTGASPLGAPPTGTNSTTGTLGNNDWSAASYIGPCPPSGIHTYRITVYALNSSISAEKNTRAEFSAANSANILGSATIAGTFKAP